MARTVESRIQKRFDDIDVFHHVNNGHQQQYFDLGKTQLYREVMGVDILSDNVRVITASTKTDYLSQVLFDYDLLVSTSVPHVGNKSMTVYQELYRIMPDGSRCVLTKSTTVLVAFDFAAQQSVPVPDSWRKVLSE